MRKLSLAVLLCCTIAILPSFAFAQKYEAPTAEAAGIAAPPQISARLISPVTATGTEGTVPLALEINLPEHWHTYWRSPGVAGLPPAVEWKTKTNATNIAFQWPRPIRFSAQGLETFGYKDHVTLPLTVTVAEPGKPLELAGRLDTIICTEICVPASAEISITLPAGAAAPSDDAPVWQAAIDKLPTPLGSDESRILYVKRENDVLKVGLTHDNHVRVTDMIVETPALHAFKAVTVTGIAGGSELSVPFDNAAEAPQVDGQQLTFTFLGITNGDAEFAIEGTQTVGFVADAAPTAATPTPATQGDVPAEGPSLLLMIAFAILGGLILNLMPCVLPVLSLKLLSVINHAGESKVRIRRGFTATSLGILLSFWVLAALTIALKETGMALGWGIQFQQPMFLAFLVVVVTFFTANMWGFFEIGLPRLLHNKFAGPVPGDSSLMTEFLTGVFATLLATPCTAPFVGTAVGFALSQTSLHIALIFSALGIGLALPYLLVAAFPAIAHHLPRPGAWMRWLKIVLGVALLATALWLVWVMWMQTGAVVAIAALVIIILLLWALLRQQMITAIILGLLLVMAPVSLPKPAPKVGEINTPAQPVADGKHSWNAFQPDAVTPIVATGKTVFIDLTASWCLTCHANKKLVLDVEPVSSALAGPDIILMRGDWTNPDPQISMYLQKYGRYGIPFNIVFGPGAPEGILLPELLTASVVQEALAKAGTKQ